MIKWIFIIVVILIFLGYIGFDVRKAVENPTTQSNLVYAKNITAYVWDKYLEKPAKYLWSEVFIKYVWIPSIKILDKKIENIERGTVSTSTAQTQSNR